MKLISLTNTNEIAEACSLLDKFLGDGFHPLEDYINQSKLKMFGVWGPTGKNLVAAGSIRVLGDELDHLDSYFLDGVNRSIDVGFIESIAVEEDYRGYGFGKQMVIRGIDFLMSYGCKDVVALCWLSGLERTSLPLLTKLGFTEVEHFIMPWQGEPCTVCGDDCTCDATLVHKKVQ